jgi:hypothetical protein
MSRKNVMRRIYLQKPDIPKQKRKGKRYIYKLPVYIKCRQATVSVYLDVRRFCKLIAGVGKPFGIDAGSKFL